MRILKNSVAIVVIIFLIVIGALLPSVVGEAMDKSTVGRTNYASIQSVKLELTEEQEPMSTSEKLILMQDYEYIDISSGVVENDTSMTVDEVREAVDIWLQPYVDAGFFNRQWLESLSPKPYIYYDIYAPEKNNIFWELKLYSPEPWFMYLYLLVDDNTGKIIFISCNSDEIMFDLKERPIYLNRFSEVYFGTWELGAIREYWDQNNLVEVVEPNGDAVMGLKYTIGDIDYGEIRLGFYIHQHGFFVQMD